MNMVNKKYIIYVLIILTVLFGGYYFLGDDKEDNNLIFSYPEDDIVFAGKKIPMSGDDYINKQRFDKEFLVSGNSLYQFYLYIKRYPLYIPYIEERLSEEGIPKDFKYLPIAESALREDIVSSAGAGGIWQFMPETAERFGLIVNDEVDERFNFEKSTDAALKYLKFLYEEFGDRTLAAAAYNRGEGGISKALETQGVDNYYDLYLNEETSRYVFRIVSIKYLILDYFNKKSLIDSIIGGVYENPETKIINAKSIANLVYWCNENGYNYKSVKVLNPWILGNSLPLGDWEIKVLK